MRIVRAAHRPGLAPAGGPCGEVAEWSMAHAWKVCRRGTVSRVRIPLSPPLALEKPFSRSDWGRIFPLFPRVMREGLNTAPASAGPEAFSPGRYSPDLMTAPIWCSACNSLFFNEFPETPELTSMPVAFGQMEPISNICAAIANQNSDIMQSQVDRSVWTASIFVAFARQDPAPVAMRPRPTRAVAHHDRTWTLSVLRPVGP